MNLIEAVFTENLASLKELLKSPDICIDLVDTDARTALMHAVIDRKGEITRLLLEAGSNSNMQDNGGNSPLHFATQGYETEIAELLIENGATVDIKDNNGNTPLSNAVFNSQGHGELITLLLSKGADKDLKNTYGTSPQELAESIGNYDVSKFIR